ncbi:MAG: DUF4445 domain-containing protein, partial [Actinomycetia bacterium]|nr:DUF4445 domain-containing protein [Actinomycetes bacterium]
SICIAGNTIMLHLLAGINPKYIREAPYIPATNFGDWWKGKDFSLETAEASVYLMPCVASYMGGDITAGLISTGIFESEDMSLFIDIGTNGEIVFGNKEWLISCSCSAGPAFEGGGIQFGMRASRGAIEQVRINKETGEPMILTVGQSKPVGICGSGLIDLLAELFLSGIIDQKGKFNQNKSTERIRKGEHGNEYVLVWSKDSKINKDIIITEVDIDNLIRAKAAVFAGITILLESVNISFEAIKKIIIGGSFGNFLEVEKAVTIGLLPDIPPEKYYFVGNSSLHGAYLTALSKDMLKKSIEVARKMTYLELSENSKFMDRYVSAMFLPHTDLNLFPSIKQQVLEVAGGRTR